MTALNKKYYIRFSPLTPLCVGTGNEGDWVKGADYVVDKRNKKVYVIDLGLVQQEGIDLQRVTDLFLKGDNDGIVTILGNKIGKTAKYIFDLPCDSDNNIKTFERSQLLNKPLVPGSSLKGAIRSALFNYLRDNEANNEAVFGNMKEGTDFMRFIQVGDIVLPQTRLFNTKIFNLQGHGMELEGGWKHAGRMTSYDFNSLGFNTLYECVATGDIGYGTISLCSIPFQALSRNPNVHMPHEEKKRGILNGNLHSLFAIINQVTKSYLQRERHFFDEFPAEYSDEIIECIDYLLEKIPADNSCCLLKMSAGSGYHAITGAWKYNDFTDTAIDRKTGKMMYKSRKIVEEDCGLSLMGFVKLSDATEAEYFAHLDRMSR